MSLESLSKEEISTYILNKLEDQTTFGFNELRTSINNIDIDQKLKSTLELFCFGTIQDYNHHKERYLELSSKAEFKLLQLSIVSKALLSNQYNYNTLLSFLGIENIQILEKLIIESIYSNILDAKLFNQEQILKINYSIGRDVLLENDDLEKIEQQYGKIVKINDLIDGLNKFGGKIDKGIDYIDEISNNLKDDDINDENDTNDGNDTNNSSIGSIRIQPDSPSNTRKRKIEIK
ncbi:COP9 signalosome complex subunit 7 [Wickerhamomyces ciferrii]|uniref:COP9 signalosome complex subunit 7 n=1 Tax=Wickerhamomyces ciferrii (strain ATCC 14091 / BCRC 22168 / CBS 111 / JCM 3599 / NBRC 0793 / NRRL Y-1031 F-60-10) TaxID=1206466 RepID=K0KR40_WICCF|nr:COP9 signalosome complex subunit 7 [Wickerhamomyces ciferrii]CCH45611.1 COP9 signalosome complex subunit 7 [Wickerhamomyces ciferrii]